ncbi:DUF3570 domain-containing protein [bacterium]|nr:DUF3570 domain-containing protein [bacterium]
MRKVAFIKPAVAALAAALLGGQALPATGQDNVETSLLLYSEKDRVEAAEGIVNVGKMLKGDRTLNLRLTYDALSGASPSGATPSSRVQTFTSPSGRGSYTINPGETPLDNTFHDTRFAGDITFGQPVGRMSALSLGAHLSSEHDYFSAGFNAGMTRDFNQRNTTVGLSGSVSFDNINPEGGVPTALAVMPGVGATLPREGSSDSKSTFDLVAGVSQILDRKTIVRFNYSFSHASGYLTDPYKIVSVVEPESSADAGEPVRYLYESRPDSRTKHALYGQIRRYIAGSTIDLSYRHFWDDWGVTSNTIELFYRQKLPGGHALQPHVRWYHQSAADFHRVYLLDGAPTPEHASADYRLARFDGLTLGLTYSLPIGENMHLNITPEFYTQRGDSSPPEAFGVLRQYDLFPDMDVIMVRAGFSYGF